MDQLPVSNLSRDVLRAEIERFRAAIARLELLVMVCHEERERSDYRYQNARIALKEARDELADAIEAYQELKRTERKVS